MTATFNPTPTVLHPENAPVFLIASLTANPHIDAAGYMEIGASIGRFFLGMTSFVRRVFVRRQVCRQLSAMDDRLLDDIGLTRGDIEDVISGRRDPRSTAPAAPKPAAPVTAMKPAYKAPKVEAILRRAA